MLKRFIYLGYYIKKLNKVKFAKFSKYVIKYYSFSKSKLWCDVLFSSIKYNISLLDYFYFKFYVLTKEQRRTFAGTGYMYEYQLLMNPIKERKVLENKLIFLKKYAKFISHAYSNKEDFLSSEVTRNKLFNNSSRKLVLKSSDGQCGDGIQVLNLNKLSEAQVLQEIKNSNNDLIEEFIVQHDELMKISSSGLNTVRIFTQMHNNDVDILGVRLRITINSYVDNLAAGNIAAPVNKNTGIVEGKGVYSDVTKNDVTVHPVSGIKIVGFQLPFWSECLNMVKEAALTFPENKSIGWDVAITNSGPELLEGNHNWCKLLWQLPVKKGLKFNLAKYS